MNKYTLNSGKIVEISLSSVEVALNLYRAILTECKNANVDISNLDEKTLLEVFQTNIEAIINIFASELVMDAVKDCCKRVVYNKQKFSMDLFEDEKNRADFFPIMQLVAMENLAPFFPNLRIVFETIEASILK